MFFSFQLSETMEFPSSSGIISLMDPLLLAALIYNEFNIISNKNKLVK